MMLLGLFMLAVIAICLLITLNIAWKNERKAVDQAQDAEQRLQAQANLFAIREQEMVHQITNLELQLWDKQDTRSNRD